MGTIGMRENDKACFESRDKHFDCLDEINDRIGNIIFLIVDNHFKCPNTYAAWKECCPPENRRF